MAYKVRYKESVEKDLRGIPKDLKVKIINSIETDLSKNPKVKGKSLKGKWEGLWKYEVWPYRVIYAIMEESKSILVVRIGHRKDVYRK